MKVVGGGMIATIGSSMLCMSLPYAPGLNAKHLSWAGKWLVATRTGNCRIWKGAFMPQLLESNSWWLHSAVKSF